MSARSILIVEPNPGILIVGRNVLARAGFHVVAVHTVEEGLEEARRNSFDVVLLDGRASEPEVLLHFARSRARGVPIVLTVQKGRDVITIEALEAGGWSELVDVADVIEKPFAQERLLQAVEKAVQRAGERTDPNIIIDIEEFPLIEEPAEEERTEKFEKILPFGSLLESVSGTRPDLEARERGDTIQSGRTGMLHARLLEPEDDSPTLSYGVDGHARLGSTRFVKLTSRLSAFLERERIDIEPRQLLALVNECEQVFVEERGASLIAPAGGGDLAFHGHIQHLPIDQVLQIASSVGHPSRCRLEFDGQAIEIYFRHGNVIFARQANMPSGFTLGRLLVASGVVNELDVERAFSRSGLPALIGKRLLALGHIRERDLKIALRRQTEELVYEAVRWTHGRFAVFAKEHLPQEAEDADISLPVQHLLLEGMRRLDEWRRMAKDVGDFSAVLDRNEHALAPDLLESLRPEERMLLEKLDGQKTVEDIVRSMQRPTYDVLKVLQSLRGQRLVTVIAPIASA
jgi:DNA-binding response OmpR family regulator